LAFRYFYADVLHHWPASAWRNWNADSVTCPDNPKGVEGATLRCQLTDAGQKYGISVTATSVDAGAVNFDFHVDDHPE
jgi:hypothetical protein